MRQKIDTCHFWRGKKKARVERNKEKKMTDIAKQFNQIVSTKSKVLILERKILFANMLKQRLQNERKNLTKRIAKNETKLKFLECAQCKSQVPLPKSLSTLGITCVIGGCLERCDCSICLRNHILKSHFGIACVDCLREVHCIKCLWNHLQCKHDLNICVNLPIFCK